MEVGAVAVEVVAADHLGVGHQRVGDDAGQPLGQSVDRPPQRPPLAASLLDAVDVEGGGHPGQPEQRHEEGVGGVDHQRGVVAAVGGVETGEQGVDGGVEVLAGEGGEHHQLDAAPAPEMARCGVRPAVDGDRETGGCQPGRQLLHQGLVAAVAAGDAAAAEQGHPQRSAGGRRHSAQPFDDARAAHSGAPGRPNQQSISAAGTVRRPWTSRRRARISRRWRQSQP